MIIEGEGGDAGTIDSVADDAAATAVAQANGGAEGEASDKSDADDVDQGKSSAERPHDDASWYGTLSTDKPNDKQPSDAEWMANKGFSDPAAMVKAMRALEAKLGGKGLAPPGEDATDEERAAWRKATGVPETVEGYAFEVPEGFEADMSVLSIARDAALKSDMPAAAWNGMMTEVQSAIIDQHHAMVDAQNAERDTVYQEWGGQKDQNLALFQRGMKAFGFKPDEVQAMQMGLAQAGVGAGARRMLELGLKLGQLSGEDGFIPGASKSFGISPAEARAELERLESDKDFYDKKRAGDKAAIAKHDRLIAVVAADDERKKAEL